MVKKKEIDNHEDEKKGKRKVKKLVTSYHEVSCNLFAGHDHSSTRFSYLRQR